MDQLARIFPSSVHDGASNDSPSVDLVDVPCVSGVAQVLGQVLAGLGVAIESPERKAPHGMTMDGPNPGPPPVLVLSDPLEPHFHSVLLGVHDSLQGFIGHPPAILLGDLEEIFDSNRRVFVEVQAMLLNAVVAKS